MSPPDVAMGSGAEFDMIRQLRQGWGRLAVGLGDDAAVLDVPRGNRLVATTDSSVERVHFRRDWLTLEEIGYRAVTAALSDLAAMAAQPLGVLVAMSLPRELASQVGKLGEGIGSAVEAAGTVIIGGNLSQSDALTITTTALGTAFEPLGRAAVQPGDLVYLTGALGAPTAAFKSLKSGARPPAAIMQRFVRPSARIAEARWLAQRGAIAAVDISDGLAADAGHLAAASGCGLKLDMKLVPLFAGAEREDALGGEEYELLVASRAPLPADEFSDRFDLALTLIGRAVEGEPVVHLDHAMPLGDTGWVHFEI